MEAAKCERVASLLGFLKWRKMMIETKDFEIESIAYDNAREPYRGFSCRASYLKEPHQGDALIEIFREEKLVRKFLYPAYKIYNILAHFNDIVDGELEGHDGGYRAASWNGITPTGPAQPLPNQES